MLMLRYKFLLDARGFKGFVSSSNQTGPLFVVSEFDVLPSRVPFFFFRIFYPIKVQGLHCQFSSLLRVMLGKGERWRKGWGGREVGPATV